MPQSRHPLIEARRDQMFPVLEPTEVGRLWRFGELKSYAAGDRIAATGVLASIDLAKEIDSVQNREPRLSRAIIEPGGHISLHSHKGDPTIV
jgi:hypothetical protein